MVPEMGVATREKSVTTVGAAMESTITLDVMWSDAQTVVDNLFPVIVKTCMY